MLFLLKHKISPFWKLGVFFSLYLTVILWISDYSKIVISIALMFNYYLPINFNAPYKACNIIDFWRRWHITLSTFLKKYLYIPMGGYRTQNSVTEYAELTKMSCLKQFNCIMLPDIDLTFLNVWCGKLIVRKVSSMSILF